MQGQVGGAEEGCSFGALLLVVSVVPQAYSAPG